MFPIKFASIVIDLFVLLLVTYAKQKGASRQHQQAWCMVLNAE